MHCGFALHWVGPCLFIPPLEGSGEGLQSSAQLPCSWAHQEGFVMTSSGLQPPAWLPVGRICLFWHRGLFHMEGQQLATTLTLGISSTSVHLPSSWSFGCTLGVSWEEWAGMCFSRAPQLSLVGLKRPICRGWPAAIMIGSTPFSPHPVCGSVADMPLCVLIKRAGVLAHLGVVCEAGEAS